MNFLNFFIRYSFIFLLIFNQLDAFLGKSKKNKSKESCKFEVDIIDPQYNLLLGFLENKVKKEKCKKKNKDNKYCFLLNGSVCSGEHLGEGGEKKVIGVKCCKKMKREDICDDISLSQICSKDKLEANVRMQDIQRNNNIIRILDDQNEIFKITSGEVEIVDDRNQNTLNKIFVEVYQNREVGNRAKGKKNICHYTAQKIFNKGSLNEYMLKSGELKKNGSDVLCTLLKLRENKIIHGDIKPHNFLCHKDRKDTKTSCYLHDNDDLWFEGEGKPHTYTGHYSYTFYKNFYESYQKSDSKLSEEDAIKFALNISRKKQKERESNDLVLDDIYAYFKIIGEIHNASSRNIISQMHEEQFEFFKGLVGKEKDIRERINEEKNLFKKSQLALVLAAGNLENPKNMKNYIKDAIKFLDKDAWCLRK